MKHTKKRKKRIEATKSFIKEKQPIKKEKLVAQCSLDLSVTRRKAKEYINTLETAEKIKVDSEEMVTISGDEEDE